MDDIHKFIQMLIHKQNDKSSSMTGILMEIVYSTNVIENFDHIEPRPLCKYTNTTCNTKMDWWQRYIEWAMGVSMKGSGAMIWPVGMAKFTMRVKNTKTKNPGV